MEPKSRRPAFPFELDFYMPGEFQEHACCWMSWPCEDDGVTGSLTQQRRIYAEVAEAIVRHEPVNMLVDPGAMESARLLLSPDIQLIACPLDDAWLRDNGPTFLVSRDGRLGGVVWQFTGWGGKTPYSKDAKAAQYVLEQAGARIFDSQFILEGGAVTVDGEGSLITTEQCLLNPNRSGLSKAETEWVLSRYLGVRKVIWLKRGLVEDDVTEGHVDLLAGFVEPGRVMVSVTHDQDDANYHILQENLSVLRSAADADGRKLDIIEVELAPPAYWKDPRSDMFTSQRLCGSYLNFYFANGAVIIPGLDNAETDQKARNIFEETFPEREVVQVASLFLYSRGGNIHCITQQQPKI